MDLFHGLFSVECSCDLIRFYPVILSKLLVCSGLSGFSALQVRFFILFPFFGLHRFQDTEKPLQSAPYLFFPGAKGLRLPGAFARPAQVFLEHTDPFAEFTVLRDQRTYSLFQFREPRNQLFHIPSAGRPVMDSAPGIRTVEYRRSSYPRHPGE